MTAYVHSAAYDSGYLKVGEIHSIYYEQYGREDGKPVFFVHGGPGVGTSQADTRFFDPAIYRVVLLDQRGAGKSKPTCELRENTTNHLIDDIEAVRKHLNIPRWHLVYGGSWGSALTLLYAQAYPEKVSSIIVSGIFLIRESELAWDNYGAPQIYPEAFEKYLDTLPAEDRHDPIAGHYKILTSGDRTKQMKSVRALDAWVSTHMSIQGPAPPSQDIDEQRMLDFNTLNIHYIHNRCFIEDGQVLKEENMKKIRHIPCTIVQGRFDMFCPPTTAWDLHKAWPGSNLIIVESAGHSSREPGIFKELIKACDEHGSQIY